MMDNDKDSLKNIKKREVRKGKFIRKIFVALLILFLVGAAAGAGFF